MNRRAFLTLLTSGIAGYTLDVDKLLWVPPRNRIFVPSVSHGLTTAQIVAMELERILPKIAVMFEHDEFLYTNLNTRQIFHADSTTRIPIRRKS